MPGFQETKERTLDLLSGITTAAKRYDFAHVVLPTTVFTSNRKSLKRSNTRLNESWIMTVRSSFPGYAASRQQVTARQVHLHTRLSRCLIATSHTLCYGIDRSRSLGNAVRERSLWKQRKNALDRTSNVYVVGISNRARDIS